jgi:adenylate cyclase, class 2
VAGGVETESKHRIRDRAAVVAALQRLGFAAAGESLQDDRYYDTAAGLLHTGDLVVRLRVAGERATACFKGPRTYLPDGSYSRLEVELPTAAADEVQASLSDQGLRCVWRMQKRRRYYRHPGLSMVVCLDELPALGEFVELEGDPDAIATVREALGGAVGAPERLNYRELAARWLTDRDDTPTLVFPPGG